MKDEKAHSQTEKSAPVDWDEVHRRLRHARAAVEEALTPSPEEKRSILKARARELAQETGEEGAAGESAEVVEILLAGERYAVESGYVREVYPLREITGLPGTPPFVLGVTNVRGRVVAVNDLRRFFGLPETRLTENGKLVILRHDRMELGVLADAVLGARPLPLAELQPPPAGGGAEYLRGVTGDRTALLDAERILTDERIVIDEEVEA